MTKQLTALLLAICILLTPSVVSAYALPDLIRTTYVSSMGSSLMVATVSEGGAPIYALPSSGSARVAVLGGGEAYPIQSTAGAYYKVRLLDGLSGYISKERVTITRKQRLVLGWNAFSHSAGYLVQNSVSTNLGIVSPRWFSLQSGSSPVKAAVDADFVAASHRQGKKVWPMIGNSFDDALTAAVIGSPDRRKQAVATIVRALVESGADGINVDFENIRLANKDDFTAFVAELGAAAHPYGKTVSVDVTRTNPDPNWSASYDRRALGRAADYVVLMGYEEHYEGSAKPGSVGSLPWVREGIRLLLGDVPAHKVILGVPFYTREWITDLATDKVTSTDLSMQEADARVVQLGLLPAWDASAGQYVVDYTSGGKRHQIWLEDNQSMQARLALAREYQLGGAACWYVGQESKDIWSVFDTFR